jgi:hypothetical protein
MGLHRLLRLGKCDEPTHCTAADDFWFALLHYITPHGQISMRMNERTYCLFSLTKNPLMMTLVPPRNIVGLFVAVAFAIWVLTVLGGVGRCTGGPSEYLSNDQDEDRLNKLRWDIQCLQVTTLNERPPTTPRLHLFMPINRGAAGQRFCRSVLTAIVHGYDPLIYNWDREGDYGRLQLAKVEGESQHTATSGICCSSVLTRPTERLGNAPGHGVRVRLCSHD